MTEAPGPVATKPSLAEATARLPPAWKSVLEQAARASDETLILYSCGIEGASVGQTADRLADLGYLRITRAGHYSLTPQGRALLSERPEQVKKVNPGPLRHGKVMILAAIIAAMATLAWLLV